MRWDYTNLPEEGNNYWILHNDGLRKIINNTSVSGKAHYKKLFVEGIYIAWAGPIKEPEPPKTLAYLFQQMGQYAEINKKRNVMDFRHAVDTGFCLDKQDLKEIAADINRIVSELE